MIKERKFNQLMHDFKRIAKLLPFIKDINNKKKRADMVNLLQDELDRFYEDLLEAKNGNGNGVKKDA